MFLKKIIQIDRDLKKKKIQKFRNFRTKRERLEWVIGLLFLWGFINKLKKNQLRILGFLKGEKESQACEIVEHTLPSILKCDAAERRLRSTVCALVDATLMKMSFTSIKTII